MGPGQLGFTCVVAAQTAEGLKKPEGGTGEDVAVLASHGRRELGRGRRWHPEQNAVGTKKPQERRIPSRRRESAVFTPVWKPVGRRTPVAL